MKEYHILSLSGGKDSTALAFFMKENMHEIHEKIEYWFYDTGCDLPETYDYLNKIEVFLNKKIIRIKPEKSFDHIFHTSFLIPAPHRRYCTVELKVKPSWDFIYKRIEEEGGGEGIFNFYVGIRADEQWRKGISPKTEEQRKIIKAQYPFIENSINITDVEKILADNGISYPDYYLWRKRNGCYFCFYQKPIDWINLYEHHPELYEKAMYYEERGRKSKGNLFTWCSFASLREMIKPYNIKKIKEKYMNNSSKEIQNNLLIEHF